MSQVSLGIDIGGSSVKCVALLRGAVASSATSRTYARPGSDELLAAMRSVVVRVMAGPGLQASPEVPVGVCMPGIFDAGTRRITASVNVPGLVGLEIDELVRRAVEPLSPLSIRVVSDALAAGYDFGETAQRKPGRLLALSLGTGVGGVVLDDGMQLLVNPGTSGHMGQIDVSLSDDVQAVPRGPDGGRGSLEGYIGLPALRARFGDGLRDALGSMSVDDPAVRALARGIRVLHAIYRPHCVALLGGVGAALGQSPAGPKLRELIDRDLTSLARPGWELAFGTTLYHASAGAARLASKGA